MVRPRNVVQAFTLIELLIVVAIIAILAAIAVPNFLEAQVRSKISRVRGEMRTISIGLESYRTDNNAYPVDPTGMTDEFGHYGYVDDVAWLNQLTTPTPYLSNVSLVDPFEMGSARVPHKYVAGRWMRAQRGASLGYGYINLPIWRRLWEIDLGHDLPDNISMPPYWVVTGRGPDRTDSLGYLYQWGEEDPKSSVNYVNAYYDPSNGTTSSGDLVRWGP